MHQTFYARNDLFHDNGEVDLYWQPIEFRKADILFIPAENLNNIKVLIISLLLQRIIFLEQSFSLLNSFAGRLQQVSHQMTAWPADHI